jgi:hypothetical protein
MPHLCSDRAPSSSRAAGNACGSHVTAEAARPLSWRNALFLSPMTLAAHRCWPAIRTWTLAAGAGGQRGLSSGRASIVPCEPGDMGAGAPRSPARRWPEPAARGHGVSPLPLGNRCHRVRFPCAAAHPGAAQARCGSSRAGRHRGRRAVGAAGCRGAVDGGRQRIAAPVTGYGVQASLEVSPSWPRTVSAIRSWQPSGSNLADYLE